MFTFSKGGIWPKFQDYPIIMHHGLLDILLIDLRYFEHFFCNNTVNLIGWMTLCSLLSERTTIYNTVSLANSVGGWNSSRIGISQKYISFSNINDTSFTLNLLNWKLWLHYRYYTVNRYLNPSGWSSGWKWTWFRT